MKSSSRSGVGGSQDQANPDTGTELDIEMAEGVVLPPVSRPRDRPTWGDPHEHWILEAPGSRLLAMC